MIDSNMLKSRIPVARRTQIKVNLRVTKGVFMLIVMRAHATEEQVRAVCERVESLGFRAHPIPGAQRTAIGITGNSGAVEAPSLEEMAGVQEVIRVSKPYKLVSKDVKEEPTIVRFTGTDGSFGSRDLGIVAGPCSVESREQ